MSKKSLKIALFIVLTSYATSIISSCERQFNLVIQSSNLDQALYNYFKNLDPDNTDINTLIKNTFDTENQDVVDFVVAQTDHVNLAVSIFKKHFTPDEIKCILDFHTSATGQKFGAYFPNIMTEYSQALDTKINGIKMAMVAYAKNKQD